MKALVIDADVCQGTGQCVAVAPELIELDADGIARLRSGSGGVVEELAHRIASTCPTMAITVVDAR